MLKRALLLVLAASLFAALSIQSDAILHPSLAAAQNKHSRAERRPGVSTPGDDRKLASWAKIVEYFQKLDAASDRVIFEEIGKSTMGAPFVYATISAPENLTVRRYRWIQDMLADPATTRLTARVSPADSPVEALSAPFARCDGRLIKRFAKH